MAYNTDPADAFRYQDNPIWQESHGPRLLEASGENHCFQMRFFSGIEMKTSFRKWSGLSDDRWWTIFAVQFLRRKCLPSELMRTQGSNRCCQSKQAKSEKRPRWSVHLPGPLKWDSAIAVPLWRPHRSSRNCSSIGYLCIKLLNSSSNRHIAEIMNEKMNHLYALMLTVAAEKVERKGKTVLTFYEGRLGARR
jgi:hypothetical protein